MPRTQTPGVVVSTYLPPDEADALRKQAALADRTIAAEIRRALRPYLNDERRPREAAAVQEPAGQGRHDEG